MNTTKTLTTFLTVPLLALLGFGCGADTEPEDQLRMLPISAVTQAGDEVLVGTYNEATSELVLTPSFVDAIEVRAAGQDLDLAGSDQVLPFTGRSSWDTNLAVGDALDLVSELGGELFIGGTLVVHERTWTDSLTESEAASSFPACFDPFPCSLDLDCTTADPEELN